MKKYIKPILLILLGLLALAQLFHPERNLSNDQTNHIRTKFPIPESVEATLAVACYDCHSNNTRYPWYANIQPVSAWLAGHIRNGKKKLNFSELATRRIALQNHKMEEIVEVIQEGEMPLKSYTLAHRDAVLSEAQKTALIGWAQAVQDSLQARFPADSLQMRRRG